MVEGRITPGIHALHPSGQRKTTHCSKLLPAILLSLYRFKPSLPEKAYPLQGQLFLASTCSLLMVEGGGFEPPKVEPADLQSAPFDRSGTPPKIKPHILLEISATVNCNALIRQIFFSPAYFCAMTAFSAPKANQQQSRRIKTPTAPLSILSGLWAAIIWSR